jgi:hypothetical protein
MRRSCLATLGGMRAGERRRDVLRKWQEHYEQLRHGEPGKRFMQCYQRRQQEEREHPWKAALYVALGTILVALGMVFALLPVLPGFLLMVPGLVLLSSRLRIVARCLDQAELCVRRGLNPSQQDSGLG